jgi:hypothetical protein
MRARYPRPGSEAGQFDEFQASELYCARCRGSRPVRERLLLVLPEGEIHQYLCAACGEPVGSRRVMTPPPPIVVRG